MRYCQKRQTEIAGRGKWRLPEEATRYCQKRQGEIAERGKWRLPQEAAVYCHKRQRDIAGRGKEIAGRRKEFAGIGNETLPEKANSDCHKVHDITRRSKRILSIVRRGREILPERQRDIAKRY